MKEVYRINVISGYKPWRSGDPYLLTDKAVFEIIKALEEEDDFYRIPAPNAKYNEYGELINEDDTLAEWLYTEGHNEEIEMPYILADEITFYTE